MLARLGGDEFGVILAGCSLEHAARVADELRAGQPASDPTYSAGIACWDGRETSSSLLARADAALYRPKHSAETAACWLARRQRHAHRCKTEPLVDTTATT